DLALAFAALLEQLFPPGGRLERSSGRRASASALSPDAFLETLCRHCPLVAEQPGAQQDAHEVLNFLLDALHEDLNKIRSPPSYKEGRDFLSEDDIACRGEERFAAEAWHDHLQRHRSMLVDLCQGQLRSQVRCCECSYSSVTF
ncbi:unnamed protein product, partial [Polarella glacialis]